MWHSHELRHVLQHLELVRLFRKNYYSKVLTPPSVSDGIVDVRFSVFVFASHRSHRPNRADIVSRSYPSSRAISPSWYATLICLSSLYLISWIDHGQHRPRPCSRCRSPDHRAADFLSQEAYDPIPTVRSQFRDFPRPSKS